MITVILVIHIFLAVGLVGTVLLQRSEGGGLGMGGGGGGGGGGGMGGFMTGRDTASFLTRTTAVLAAAFMATSLALAVLAGGGREATSIMDQPAVNEQPAQPAVPEVPIVPAR